MPRRPRDDHKKSSEPPRARRPVDRTRLRALLNDARDVIWRARRRLLLGLPLMLVNRVAGLALPLTTKYLFDDVIAKGHHEMLWRLAVITASAALVTSVSDFALSQVLGIAAQRSITELRVRVQQHVQRLSIRYFDTNKSGALVSRVMNDAEGIRNLVGTGLVQLCGGIVTAAIAFGILFYLSARLAFIIFGTLFIFTALLAWGFRTLRPLFKLRNEINAQVTGRLTEAMQGIRVVKAYRSEQKEARVFAAGAHRLLRNVLLTMRIMSGASASTSLLVGFIGLAVLLVGGNEVLSSRLTIGGLISFTMCLGLVVGPLVSIVAIGTQLSEAFAGLERIRELLSEPTEDAGDAQKEHIPNIDGMVEFEHVTFEYSPGVPVLHDVTFTARAGTVTALVGPSGSGKSTLIALVSTFHRATSGRILVDGRNIDDFRLRDYRGHLGIVPQDSFLFADSIYANIALGNPRANRDEVLRAAHIAHVDEFAERFDEGYETVVGERGVRLSGGQKQRVAIARAIVADPRILILDEATSSLDSESEALIQDGLTILMKGRTTFVIAHRLSTIRRADQIIFLEDGHIVEHGTHDELIALGGRYRTLYERQYGVSINLFVNRGEEIEDLEVVKT
jgi:subfamily B ATP-binding cassette protein MsbA